MKILSCVAAVATLSLSVLGVKKIISPPLSKECVFNNLMGEVEMDSTLNTASLTAVESSVTEGLEWLEKAQHKDGGWGAGSHHRQGVMDPHKVPSDPATTAMVSMALLRSGSTLSQGDYQNQLKQSTEFLLNTLEKAIPNGSKITELKGTQIQRKLGENIDLVLSLQYMNNLLEKLDKNDKLYDRVFNAINKSVDMVQMVMDAEGRMSGAGWAGVLQSAYATNALEVSATQGAAVDNEKLEQARKYQTSNYDAASSKVKTKDGAGIMLYSVSGSVRANAKKSKEARKIIQQAKREGKINDEAITLDNFRRAGIAEDRALLYETADQVYQSAKVKAQEKEVLNGFGNNGGEEFLSFLQTGESLIVNEDNSWTKWYNDVSANLLNIQNKDGSWNGHHCITSPVFCTATCVLILTVNNDIEQLQKDGESEE